MNSIINNFDPLDSRQDHGLLWENYVVSEFHKRLKHTSDRAKMYFWRSKGGAEVDLVLQDGGRYRAFEIKYNPKKRPRFPASFLKNYQPQATAVVNRENFWEVL